MKLTKNQPNNAKPGFTIRLTDETDLGDAMLIAEGELGGYLPISPVATIAEGREMAEQDLEFRMRQLENGQQPSARRSIGSGREVDSREPDLRRSGMHREFRDMSCSP